MEREKQNRPGWQTGQIDPGGQSTPSWLEHLSKGFKVTLLKISSFGSKLNSKQVNYLLDYHFKMHLL